MRGRKTEGAVLNSIQRNNWLMSIFEVIMLSSKFYPSISCSPGAISVLYFTNSPEIEFSFEYLKGLYIDGRIRTLASVDIKTTFSRRAVSGVTSNIIHIYVHVTTSPEVQNYLTQEHICQFIHHMLLIC